MGEEERSESSYLAGKARAGVEVLHLGLELAGCEGRDVARMAMEIAEARNVLRRLCATHGDLDWGDDLHLADVIDKHLGKYLEE